MQTQVAVSASITGQVIDSMTGNPVPDASVTIEDGNAGTSTDMAGEFIFTALNENEEIILNVTHLNYESKRTETAPGIEMITIELNPVSYRLDDVVVSIGRGVPGRSAASLSNLSSELIETAYGSAEPPLIASEVPNATYFSWGGNNLGPAHLKIRGFDSNRLAISINGVPANDPEDHNVYWQNTPDFLSNTYDMQVERGVSGFKAGPAGIGGGLNLVTNDAVANRELSLSLLGGKFNTFRRTLNYRSGLVEQRYNFTGRFSQVETDGYRDHSGADMWGYFLGATRYDPNMVTRMQVYGGQEETDLNYTAISKDMLESNRTYNPAANAGLDYDGERDFFQQPHYILLNRWKIAQNLELDQSLFWIHGFGFYEQYKSGRDYFEYSLDANGDGVVDGSDSGTETDLIRRKYVEKDQVGWMPRLNWELGPITTIGLGLELRFYDSDHYGRILWGNNLPAGITPDYKFYGWTSQKDYIGGFANLDRQLNEKMNLNLGIQLRNITYSVEQEKLGGFNGYSYEVDYLFVNPRAGLTYQLSDRTTLFTSVAMSGREPVDDQVLNADNPYDVPKLSKYGYSEIDAERMLDIEIGGRSSVGNLDFGGNLYVMMFENEIVSTGVWDPALDEVLVTNAPTSQHIGVEIDGTWKTPIDGLTASGNIALDQSTFGSFDYLHTNPDWSTEQLNLDGNRIALTPGMTMNLRGTYKVDPITASLKIHHVGKQYLDNREVDDATLDAYTLLDGVLRCKLFRSTDFHQVELQIHGTNLLDVEYEPFGWVEPAGPMYIPAAGRSYMAGITFNL